MHDAAVAGMLCARRYGAITQGRFGGVADRIGDDELAGAATYQQPALSHLRTRRD